MKKKTILLLVLIILFIGTYHYIRLPDYHEVNSMSFSDPNGKSTELNVIAYQYWNTDRLLQDIKEHYTEINDTPATLEIRLYHTKWHFRHGKEPFRTVIFKNE